MKAKEVLAPGSDYSKGSYKDDRAKVFLVVATNMTRRPKETLNLERFMLEIRTHQKVTRKKNATLKQVIPSLEDFKTQQIQS